MLYFADIMQGATEEHKYKVDYQASQVNLNFYPDLCTLIEIEQNTSFQTDLIKKNGVIGAVLQWLDF